MKPRLPFILFSCLLLAILGVQSPASERTPPASPEVTAAMQPYLDSYKLAGLVSIIADKSGRVHYKNILGYADVEAKKPMSEDNVFWIASMTKMFAGASIMMLVDEGKVSLDDPVTKFIPQLTNWMVIAENSEISAMKISSIRRASAAAWVTPRCRMKAEWKPSFGFITRRPRISILAAK